MQSLSINVIIGNQCNHCNHLIIVLNLKFDNDVVIKLGRAARLWNGPSLRGYKWRNGARFQNKNQNGLQTNVPNKLADGVLNRLCVKWDFANTNLWWPSVISRFFLRDQPESFSQLLILNKIFTLSRNSTLVFDCISIFNHNLNLNISFVKI